MKIKRRETKFTMSSERQELGKLRKKNNGKQIKLVVEEDEET